MLIYKDNNDDKVNTESSVFNYKPYIYSRVDALKQYEKFDVCKIDFKSTMKIKNSTLYINGYTYDITTRTIGDVLELIRTFGASVSLFAGREHYMHLPALLCTDMNNKEVLPLDGYESPFRLDSSPSLQGKTVVSVNVYDKSSDKIIDSTIVNQAVYYTPNPNTSVIVTTLETSFYLQIDLSPKRLVSPTSVATLLNYGEFK